MAIIGTLAFIGLVILVFRAVRGAGRFTYKQVTGNDPKVNAARAARYAGSRPARGPLGRNDPNFDPDAAFRRDHVPGSAEYKAAHRTPR